MDILIITRILSTYDTIMPDFDTLKTNAQTSVEALKKANSDQKKALENSFVEAMTTWESAVKTKEAEANTDTTKTTEATTARADFEKFKTELGEDLNTILVAKEQEKEEAVNGTEDETNTMAIEIPKPGQYTIEELQNLKNKTWKELRTDPKYIVTIQQIIIDTGAKNASISNEILTNGIYGRGTIAGIKTLQAYLKTTYTLNPAIKVDGLAGPNTLTALLEKDGDTTRVNKLITDHSMITPQALEPISSKIKKKEEIKRKKEDNGQEDDKPETGDPDQTRPAAQIKVIEARLNDKNFIKKPSKAFITARATALQTTPTGGTFGYQGKTYKYKGEKIAYIEDLTKSTENKEQIKTTMLQTLKENMQKSLINKIKTNPITFTEQKYTTYYNKNIIKPHTYTVDESNQRIILKCGEMQVKLKPENFYQNNNTVNYTTLIETIKQQVKTDVDKKEQQETNDKIQAKFNTLKTYLTQNSFSLNDIYPEKVLKKYSDGEQNVINAFFKNFPDKKVQFSDGDDINLVSQGRLQLQFKPSSDGTNPYGNKKGIIPINKQVNSEGKIKTVASLYPDIRTLIDKTINKTTNGKETTANNKQTQ